ncbi:alanyl-tRNA editing protein [Paenibacillus gallinarum]|uniref:Hydrolase n=1 Tax=Paenibacillus gallinarum TaxID=2762232 RepID=A0ABR8T1A1_9BACL|nr:DHHA1 domain-containing protein [Paenibacillus gallinarum]MBD7969343.1 hydrolase [Paenibacillus gallinarum]
MTKKMYYDSAYQTEWETNIIEAIEREDGYDVVLEETAFYPHGGGQPCDTGYIQGIPVLDVVTHGDRVLHKLERVPEDRTVSCKIDWDRRFDHMQQHSGQHLLSAVCLDLYEIKTLSFHLGVDYCTIDVETAELKAEQLENIEREVNRHIYLNHPILSYWVDETEVKSINLVKQPTVSDDIRIVEIKDVEYNACGGTHVSSTGEIGIIKLLKMEKQKGNTRIYFKCGYRALEEFNESQRILGALSSRFKTAKDEILHRIEKWEQEQKQLQAELTLLKEQNNEYLAAKLLSHQDGNLIAEIFEDKSVKDLQSLASTLSARSHAAILLASKAENKVVLSQNKEAGHSCGAFFKAHLGTYNGKGGGSDILAQAGFSTWEDAQAFYEYSSQALKEQ